MKKIGSFRSKFEKTDQTLDNKDISKKFLGRKVYYLENKPGETFKFQLGLFRNIKKVFVGIFGKLRGKENAKENYITKSAKKKAEPNLNDKNFKILKQDDLPRDAKKAKDLLVSTSEMPEFYEEDFDKEYLERFKSGLEEKNRDDISLQKDFVEFQKQLNAAIDDTEDGTWKEALKDARQELKTAAENNESPDEALKIVIKGLLQKVPVEEDETQTQDEEPDIEIVGNTKPETYTLEDIMDGQEDIQATGSTSPSNPAEGAAPTESEVAEQRVKNPKGQSPSARMWLLQANSKDLSDEVINETLKEIFEKMSQSENKTEVKKNIFGFFCNLDFGKISDDNLKNFLSLAPLMTAKEIEVRGVEKFKPLPLLMVRFGMMEEKESFEKKLQEALKANKEKTNAQNENEERITRVSNLDSKVEKGKDQALAILQYARKLTKADINKFDKSQAKEALCIIYEISSEDGDVTSNFRTLARFLHPDKTKNEDLRFAFEILNDLNQKLDT